MAEQANSSAGKSTDIMYKIRTCNEFQIQEFQLPLTNRTCIALAEANVLFEVNVYIICMSLKPSKQDRERAIEGGSVHLSLLTLESNVLCVLNM